MADSLPPQIVANQEYVLSQLKEGVTARFQPDLAVANRTITAKFVRKLLFGCVTGRDTAPVGVAIHGARIEGDLACIAFGSPSSPLPALDLSGCEIVGTIELTDSAFTSVTLANSILGGLKARYLNVGNGLRADNLWFRSAAAVDIELESIVSGGDVSLVNIGRVVHPDARMRTPDRAEAPNPETEIVEEGRISPRNGQVACRLRLSHSRIDGKLDLNGARLTGNEQPKSEKALELDGIEVAGSLEMSDSEHHRFEAVGGASILGGRIDGQLLCNGASFRFKKEPDGTDGEALTADRLVVGRSAHFSGGKSRFEAEGEIRLVGTRIGGQLNFAGARLNNPTGDALSLHRADVTTSLLLQAGSDDARNRTAFEAHGAVRLLGIKVGGDVNFGGAQLNGPTADPGRKSVALSMTGSEIGDSILLGHEHIGSCRVHGLIEASGAKIGRFIECRGSFRSKTVPSALPQAAALDFDNMAVSQRLVVRLEGDSLGEVWLRGARVGELDDNGAAGWGSRPQRNRQAMSGVLLRLDGFVYDRLCDGRAGSAAGNPPQDSLQDPPKSLGIARIDWLKRQTFEASPHPDDYFPQPHEQLAKVLHLMGHDGAARQVACHKSEHESTCGASTMPAVTWIHRKLFGAGYFPGNAAITVLVVWLIGTLGTLYALHLNTTDKVVLARTVHAVEMVRWLGVPDFGPRSPTVDRSRDKKTGAETIYAPHGRVQTRDIPCTDIEPVLYALDLMLPVVGLHVADKCDVADGATIWVYAKAVYELLSWIIVAVAALTWTGVLRKDMA